MSRPALVLERLLPAKPADVFFHWSQPESLARFMMPGEEMRHASVTVDFRVGGRFEIVMHAVQDFRQHGRYLEIEANRRIVFEWISEWMPEGERETRVTVTLAAEGADQTRIVLTHDALPDSDAYAGHQDGWARILQCLAEVAG